MNYTKTIYKKDSRGKIRQVTISAISDKLIQESGILNGKIVPNESKVKPKNIGKANETTVEEQGVIEAKAKIKKKLTQGYFETIEEAENTLVILPMLAKSYDDHYKKIDKTKPIYVQPKLDGMRCLAIIKDGKVTLKSRDGKDIVETSRGAMQMIVDQLEDQLALFPNLILDGELYAHSLGFQQNMSAIKKTNENTQKIKYNVYDVVRDESFLYRSQFIRGILKEDTNITLVNTDVVLFDDIRAKHDEYVNNGYEGLMVRHGDDTYKLSGRSASLLKYKKFIDEVYKIVDVVPSDKRVDMGQFILHCKKTNKNFGCGMKFSHEEREQILIDKAKYIGKTAEVRFFEYSDDNIPRFPVCVGVRLDK